MEEILLWIYIPFHEWKLFFFKIDAISVSLVCTLKKNLGLLVKIKCSICSYQKIILKKWYVIFDSGGIALFYTVLVLNLAIAWWANIITAWGGSALHNLHSHLDRFQFELPQIVLHETALGRPPGSYNWSRMQWCMQWYNALLTKAALSVFLWVQFKVLGAIFKVPRGMGPSNLRDCLFLYHQSE